MSAPRSRVRERPLGRPRTTGYSARDGSPVRGGSVTDTSNTRPAGSEAQAPRRSRLHLLMRYIPLIAPVLLWAVPCWVLVRSS